ncbi:MAG: c-type cytochrome [Planctomycetaceae bacterium]|nr:c-type cytochrome [Planctomycetaceae bacterium]
MRVYFLLILMLPAVSGSILHAEEVRLDRPVAVIVEQEKNLAWVANGGNGHIVTVDLEQQQIIRDLPIGQRLSDLVQLPGQPNILAADPDRRELILLKTVKDKLNVLRRIPLPLEPDRLAVSQEGNFVAVTSPSEPALCLVDLKQHSESQPVIDLIPLSVPVRNVMVLPDGKSLATDRFGGRLFVIDPVAKIVVTEHEFRGHNIRGLTLDHSGESVLVAHQILSRLSHSTYEDIHWGMLLQNVISRIPLASLLQEEVDLNRARRLIHVGNATDAAADPFDIIPHDSGYIVTASGADKVIVRVHTNVQPQTIATDHRPTRLARINKRRVLLLNEFSDSLQILEPTTEKASWWEVTATIGTPREELSAAERGERLFYDARLTHDRWFSCNSCHVDGHSPDLFADTLGDGAYGNPKRIPSLLGTGDTGPWGWTGSLTSLEDQIEKTLDSTMHGGMDDDETVRDLAAYLKTLPAPEPHPVEKRADVTRGRELFQSLNCNRCHRPSAYTSPKAYDIGLTDENGLSQFNPPSLRGVSRRRSFLHDGQAKTLKDAIEHHAGEADSSRAKFEKLSGDEQQALLEFLQSL